MKNKKALSAVMGVVVLIFISVVAAGIIFGVVKTTTEDRLTNSKACLDTFEKIYLEDDYTCYNETSKEVLISISRDAVVIDYLLVSVGSNVSSTSFNLTNENQVIEGVTYFPSNTESVKLPGDESGKVYALTWNLDGIPKTVKIAPRIGEKTCDAVDQINQIVICAD